MLSYRSLLGLGFFLAIAYEHAIIAYLDFVLLQQAPDALFLHHSLETLIVSIAINVLAYPSLA